ncbi:MAG: nuclear transport factor 2 family protein [Acidobacteria bacterium]|nr:nuclear transport factor 2 family protein [Acidobacteriota bacterium]
MKRLVIISVLVCLTLFTAFAQAPQRGARGAMPPPTGPIADLANAGVDAINKGDAAFFDSHLAADVVWFDEDGHAIASKERVLNFLKTKLLTPGKKVTITGLRVGDNWAGYVYKVEGAAATGGAPTVREGTQTIVYKQAGGNWQISMVHGAVKAAGHM